MNKETINKNLDDLARVGQILQKFLEVGIMPDIEKDIAISKLQSIYEFTQQIQPDKPLKSDGLDKIIKEKEEPKIITETTPVIRENIVEKRIEKEEPIVTKPIPEKKTKETTRSKTQNTKIKTEHAHPVKTEILADQFQQKSFLNEALSQYKNMSDISRKLQSRPLKDISSAISLNEKYLFIKELFNNDADLYHKTLEKLNNAVNFNEAIRYLDGRFEWDFDEEQVQKLLELVRRRYAPTNED
jgi:hypothetical protein